MSFDTAHVLKRLRAGDLSGAECSLEAADKKDRALIMSNVYHNLLKDIEIVGKDSEWGRRLDDLATLMSSVAKNVQDKTTWMQKLQTLSGYKLYVEMCENFNIPMLSEEEFETHTEAKDNTADSTGL